MTKISHEENVGADLSSKDVTEDKPKCRLCHFFINCHELHEEI